MTNETCPYCKQLFQKGEVLTSNENEDVVHVNCNDPKCDGSSEKESERKRNLLNEISAALQKFERENCDDSGDSHVRSEVTIILYYHRTHQEYSFNGREFRLL